MGMYYSITADKTTNCEDDFPESLSHFFEQVGGCGDKSEVMQVSRILEIDLSVFQLYDYGTTNVKKEKRYWQCLDRFASIVEAFIKKISENPDYYKKVLHNNDYDSQMNKIMYAKDEDSLLKVVEELYSDPSTSFPPDRGYLSQNEIMDDLIALKGLLDCYKESRATKIKLTYV